jgi:hypothetical protein
MVKSKEGKGTTFKLILSALCKVDSKKLTDRSKKSTNFD